MTEKIPTKKMMKSNYFFGEYTGVFSTRGNHRMLSLLPTRKLPYMETAHGLHIHVRPNIDLGLNQISTIEKIEIRFVVTDYL